jgi:SagB-type dehydrogenase family enzyme
VQLRRARCLIGFWEDGDFILENYLTNKRTTISPAVAQILGGADEYQSLNAFGSRWANVPDLSPLILRLLERDILVERGSPLDLKERLVDSRWEWGHDARYFHYATNDVEFESDPEKQRSDLIERALKVPPPSPYRAHEGPRVQLGEHVSNRPGELWEALKTRRTCRSFTGGSITRDQFETIVSWTWGKTAAYSFPHTGDFIVKTSPSGGARHPIETYPVVLAVQGIAPGIYHYSVRDNALVLLRPGDFSELALELCSDQPWIRDASAVFFMTAVLERSMWKYRHSHAYRVIHLDAGHLGQTFHLVCAALGLGPLTFAATRNSLIERELRLDGVAEIVVYTAAVGVPR